jgi:hypothetical protein
MLEYLEHPQVLADLYEVGSDNLRGVPQREEPGNQQERLITVGWVIGFVDGEGCFSIGFTRQPDREHRKGYRTGYQVNHDFVVPQGARSLKALNALQTFFGVGRVYVNTRHDNHREDMHAYTVHRRSELMDVIIPFFRQHELRTSKRSDFEKFATCLELIAANRHLTREGLADVAEIAQTMNREVSRQEMIRILRGHTSDSRESD